jgi:hypothetical protein
MCVVADSGLASHNFHKQFGILRRIGIHAVATGKPEDVQIGKIVKEIPIQSRGQARGNIFSLAIAKKDNDGGAPFQKGGRHGPSPGSRDKESFALPIRLVVAASNL